MVARGQPQERQEQRVGRRTRRVVGNWKMHGALARNAALLDACVQRFQAAAPGVEIVVCVPFPFLAQAQTLLRESDVAWGAQDLSPHAQGAYTGEVSASMLKEFGAAFVIVGHSERRAQHSETSALVAAKAAAALAGGLTPIICLGETLEEREADMTEAVVAGQLAVCMETLGLPALGQCVIAYEPVWAIGTGRTATAVQAQKVHAFLRARLGETGDTMTLLYGGSVKASNARELFAMPDIDGGLIGGASLTIDEFEPICRAFD
ncbi:MAG: triose-phosphate isomerase [Proteobacteria bacterium]|nr:triose-phosphate isomerase [Burkholderiales bacterium]